MIKKALYFNYYVNENANSRGLSLSEEEFIEGVRRHCKQWLSNPFPFIRGKNGESHTQYSYIKTSEIRRNNTRQFIDIWYNHHIQMDSKWKEFPDRFNAIYGTNDFNGIEYDELFFVIPVDGWKIGQVNNSGDLYFGMNYFEEKFAGNSVQYLPNLIHEILYSRGKDNSEHPKIIGNWNEWTDFWENLTEEDFQKTIDLSHGSYLNHWRTIEILKDQIKGEGILKFFSQIMDPIKNEIELIQPPKIPFPGDVDASELWTDSDCYVFCLNIDQEMGKEDVDEIYKKMLNIVNGI